MSYYMGDYYRGDYYRGDPGFWSFVKGVAKAGIGMVLPGVGGGIVKAGGRIEQIPAAMGPIERATGAVMRVGRRVGGAVVKHPVLSAAGAAGAVGAAAGALARGGGALPERGFHISKRTGAVVRNRHMRATNPKALRRALRRVGGFARVARRVMRFTSPTKKGKLHFKFAKKKK